MSSGVTSTGLLNPCRDSDSYLLGQPLPELDNYFSEEIFHNIQPKPPLRQLEAISSCAVLAYLALSTILAERFHRLMGFMVSLCLAIPKSEQQHPEPAENTTTDTRICGCSVCSGLRVFPWRRSSAAHSPPCHRDSTELIIEDNNIPRGPIFYGKRAAGLWKALAHRAELAGGRPEVSCPVEPSSEVC